MKVTPFQVIPNTDKLYLNSTQFFIIDSLTFNMLTAKIKMVKSSQLKNKKTMMDKIKTKKNMRVIKTNRNLKRTMKTSTMTKIQMISLKEQEQEEERKNDQ